MAVRPWSALAVLALALAACTGDPARTTGSSAPASAATASSPGAGAGATATRRIWSWTTTPVGQPIVVGQAVIVYTSGAGALQVNALDPATGKVLWTDATTPSDVRPGIVVRPRKVTSRDGKEYVAYYRPEGAPFARLVVADPRTGKAVATAGPTFFTSPPLGCDDDRDVCVLAQPGRYGKARPYRLDIRRNTYKKVASGPRGYYEIGDNLWHPDGNVAETLAVFSGRGRVWEKPLRSLFPGGHTPNNGWIVDLYEKAGVYVVSLGGKSRADGDLKNWSATAGIDARTGKRLWLRPGTRWLCVVLEADRKDENPHPVMCRFTGRHRFKGTRDRSKVTGVVVEGLDIRTGRATWSHPMGAARVFWNGDGDGSSALGRGGPTSFLVLVKGRKPVVLDVATGARRAPAKGETFVCTTTSTVKLSMTWYLVDGTPVSEWNAGTVAQPCDAQGKAVKAEPPHAAAGAVGATAGDVAVYATAREVVALRRG